MRAFKVPGLYKWPEVRRGQIEVSRILIHHHRRFTWIKIYYNWPSEFESDRQIYLPNPIKSNNLICLLEFL
jgi:hypothetical protein